ncbi:MAG: peptide deformylase [Thermacetogeniaceae bacterium]
MAVYKIVELGDQVLREKAVPVPEINRNILKLLDNLVDTMYAAKGVGLAAPQIGVSKRVIVVDAGEGLVELINPEIISSRGEEVAIEGCLSIPGVAGEVKRAQEVEVKGLDRTGKVVRVQAKGLFARALQHEIDHLDGILFIDKALRLFKEGS